VLRLSSSLGDLSSTTRLIRAPARRDVEDSISLAFVIQHTTVSLTFVRCAAAVRKCIGAVSYTDGGHHAANNLMYRGGGTVFLVGDDGRLQQCA
jgi:hypothetical protein